MSEDAEFTGRVVAIWSKEPARGGVLENVCLRWLGERAFLVGQLADDGTGSDPRLGATFWFPIDEVVMLTVYADLRAARAAYADRNRQTAGNGPKKPRWRFWS
jgi:hypothetical protein